MSTKERALRWFFKGYEDKKASILKNDVSEERIIEYFLRRFPWEANE